MSADVKDLFAHFLLLAGFVVGATTMFGVIWHEAMHIFAYSLVGIDAEMSSYMTVRAEENSWFGLWAAYPLEIMTHAMLSWVLVHTRVWTIALFPTGFAAGRFLWALRSLDYNSIAAQRFGMGAPQSMKTALLVIVLPVFLLVAISTEKHFQRILRGLRAKEEAARPPAEASDSSE